MGVARNVCVCVLCNCVCSGDFKGFVCCAFAFIVIALLLLVLLLLLLFRRCSLLLQHILFDGFMIICLLICFAFFVIYLAFVRQLHAQIVVVFIAVVACLSCRINVKHAVINVLFA